MTDSPTRRRKVSRQAGPPSEASLTVSKNNVASRTAAETTVASSTSKSAAGDTQAHEAASANRSQPKKAKKTQSRSTSSDNHAGTSSSTQERREQSSSKTRRSPKSQKSQKGQRSQQSERGASQRTQQRDNMSNAAKIVAEPFPKASHGGIQTMQGAELIPRLPSPGRPPRDGLRVVALGGISEIGRNMTVFEYNKKLLIIDCGVLFPSSSEPGVDLILPDLTYIEDRLDDVEALVLTHGHEDHIGAIPFLLRLRDNIPIVGSRFTNALVAAKCAEHGQHPKFVEVDESSSVTFGDFTVQFFAVGHSIPDALGIVLKTPAGVVMHTGDIKLDQTPADKRPTDLPAISRYGDDGVDLLLVDSTNATTPGLSPSESIIKPTLTRLITNAHQRVVVACFASNVSRVQMIVDAAVASRRRVSFVGRSMVRNMEIAEKLGFLTIPDGTLISIEEAGKLAPSKSLIVTTGTQGEAMAGLSRMSRGEHRQVTLHDGDLVILSSSLVPGNEEAVFGVINNLAQIGATVVTDHDDSVHVSGHGYAGELLFIYNAARPSNVMPVHGEWRHLLANRGLAISTGVKEENVVIAQNGVVVDLVDGRASVVGQMPVGYLYVDGLTMGDISEGVLSDRAVLREDGFIATTVIVDSRTGAPVRRPQVIGRGFTDEPGALDPVPELVENVLYDLAGQGENDPYRMAQAVRRTIARWVAKKWRRNPMIVPTIIASGEDDFIDPKLDL